MSPSTYDAFLAAETERFMSGPEDDEAENPALGAYGDYADYNPPSDYDIMRYCP